jgi:hypothetical protein
MIDQLIGNDPPIAPATGATYAKLNDAMVPGYEAEFDPAEAETAGAFTEDALSEADAIASVHDACAMSPYES